MLAPRRFISGDRFSVQIEPERFRQRRYIQPVRVPAPEPEPRSRQVPKVQSPGEQQKSGLPGKTKKTANSSKTQISGNTGSQQKKDGGLKSKSRSAKFQIAGMNGYFVVVTIMALIAILFNHHQKN